MKRFMRYFLSWLLFSIITTNCVYAFHFNQVFQDWQEVSRDRISVTYSSFVDLDSEISALNRIPRGGLELDYSGLSQNEIVRDFQTLKLVEETLLPSKKYDITILLSNPIEAIKTKHSEHTLEYRLEKMEYYKLTDPSAAPITIAGNLLPFCTTIPIGRQFAIPCAAKIARFKIFVRVFKNILGQIRAPKRLNITFGVHENGQVNLPNILPIFNNVNQYLTAKELAPSKRVSKEFSEQVNDEMRYRKSLHASGSEWSDRELYYLDKKEASEWEYKRYYLKQKPESSSIDGCQIM